MQSNNIYIYVDRKLKEISKNNQLRKLTEVRRKAKNNIIIKKKKLISFSCNDYLSLSINKEVINASKESILKYGVGSGASRLVTGNNELNTKLEKKIASFKKTPACCIFGRGFLANLGTIASLLNENDLVLIDELSHASAFLGVKLSKAKNVTFKHNDMNDLEKKLAKFRNSYNKCLILTEGVFSMDGDISPQDKISELKEEYQAQFMLDDAHGFGVLGDGSGSNSIFKKKPKIDIYIGTLSKAVGAYGGFVCGSKKLIQFILNRCRTQIYTTGLPPGVLAASIKSVEIIKKNKKLVKRPLENARYFCRKIGLNEPYSPIVPIIMGEEKKALMLSNLLYKRGFMVSAIRPPTVPDNSSRLRIAFNASHTREHIRQLSDIISRYVKS